MLPPLSHLNILLLLQTLLTDFHLYHWNINKMHLWCVWKDQKQASSQQDLKPLEKYQGNFLWMIVFELVGVVSSTFSHYHFSRSQDQTPLVNLWAKNMNREMPLTHTHSHNKTIICFQGFTSVISFSCWT